MPALLFAQGTAFAKATVFAQAPAVEQATVFVQAPAVAQANALTKVTDVITDAASATCTCCLMSILNDEHRVSDKVTRWGYSVITQQESIAKYAAYLS